MVYSMTGFGRSTKKNEQLSITVEMKSVNHRFCEISVRIPRQWVAFEDKIKKVILQHVKRGKVEVFVNIEGDGLVKRKLHIDWDLMKEYYHSLQRANEQFSLRDQVTLSHLFQLEGVTEIVEEETENEELEQLLLAAVKEAAEQLAFMRKQEGETLLADIQTQLSSIEKSVQVIEKQAPFVIEYYRERLTKRIHELSPLPADESRILTEVAIFAEKSDINEELKRIRSHLQQVVATLEKDEPIGRKLDFLVQELNREANTIGAKANDSLIAMQVVEIKSALEKIKEQVQNIE
ncbi:TIGR00255 family protein [Parageobacillus thermantarcticus]|uniref:TIGR00255 family protein n=1 Tax=Parageobacillus thermantarcticus TaxID=186116 RepID=A0A1I0SR49_9BACL|nr:YicC/YloC family endoribonuclease [Parageobacillus thermantarcticus]SFA42008.1 TIGR00255 family protein [Parageobacillus thermantarcticus]